MINQWFKPCNLVSMLHMFSPSRKRDYAQKWLVEFPWYNLVDCVNDLTPVVLDQYNFSYIHIRERSSGNISPLQLKEINPEHYSDQTQVANPFSVLAWENSNQYSSAFTIEEGKRVLNLHNKDLRFKKTHLQELY